MSHLKHKLRKLLNIAADDAASESEIENAISIAQRLMDRHHLTEDDLLDDPLEQYANLESAQRATLAAQVGRRLHGWESELAFTVAQIIGGVKWYQQIQHEETTAGFKTGRAVAAVMFYGIAEDAEMARVLFAEVRNAMIALAKLKTGSVFRGDGAAYCEGFVRGLGSQIDEQRKLEHRAAEDEAENSGDGNQLLVIERRTDLVTRKTKLAESWIEEHLGRKLVRRSGYLGTRTGGQDARNMGRRDGNNYKLSAAKRRKLT